MSDEESLDRTLRDPLTKVYAGGYDQPMLLLIDALDEAATYTGPLIIVRLLARLTDLPQPVWIAVTARPDPRVPYFFPEVAPFDLIRDTPADVDDMRRHAVERLAAPAETRPQWLADLDDGRRGRLAGRISQAAHGNLLCTHPDLDTPASPRGLSGLYQEFLSPEAGLPRPCWFSTFNPSTGLSAVAQGAGLTRTRIQDISGQDVEEALETCKQYLDGDCPGGPSRPFHQPPIPLSVRVAEAAGYGATLFDHAPRDAVTQAMMLVTGRLAHNLGRASHG